MGNYDNENVDPGHTDAHHFLVLISITLQRFCDLRVGFRRDLTCEGTFIMQIYRVEICVRIHGNSFGRNLKQEDSFLLYHAMTAGEQSTFPYVAGEDTVL
ncbi:unnamed protein product [Musa textilis]